MDDETESLSALQRALVENLRENKHAPIHLGQSKEWLGSHIVSLLMMRPCRCGAPISQAIFMAGTLSQARWDAQKFVKALIKPDEDLDHADEE